MNPLTRTLFFSFFMMSFTSCTIMHGIRKNHNFTQKTVSSLLEKNGNVFWIVADYATFSTVWTYHEDNIIIYRLAKGKVRERKVFPNNGISNYPISSSKKIGLDIRRNCPLILGGSSFAFQIKRGSKIEDFGWGVEIECLTSNTFQSDFLNKIVEDIKLYEMWDVRYKQ